MNPEAIFGAEGMIGFMASLRAHRYSTPKFRFPDSIHWKNVKLKFKRREDGEDVEDTSPRAFFVRLLEEASADGDNNAVGSCELVEGVAVFMECERSGPRLLRCSVQVIVSTKGDLENLYLDENQVAIYYRYDYSVEERGSLFDHPFPHVHSVPNGPPRFPFTFDHRVFPALAFIEFVMINHSHGKWLEWILDKYAKSHPGDIPEDDFLPDDYLEAYKSEGEWSKIPEAKRSEFLARIRRLSNQALRQLSDGCPSIDTELFALSFVPGPTTT